MNTESRFFNIRTVLSVVLGIVVVYALVQYTVNERMRDLELQARVLIEDQETILATIAETTARNGADTVTESIIQDCPLAERSRFDTLLGRLNTGLPRAELMELERLFGRCGGFFAERKAVMVSRLTREIEVYTDYVEQLELITGESHSEDFQVETWQRLSTEEQRQSELFSELVKKQDEIINELIDGRSVSSEEMQSILLEAREIQETLIVANEQASRLRSQLVNL